MDDLSTALRACLAKTQEGAGDRQERVILTAKAADMLERLQVELEAAQQVNRENHDLIVSLRREAAENEGAYQVWRRRTGEAEDTIDALAQALHPFARYAEEADLFPEMDGAFGEIIVRGIRRELRWSHLRHARDTMREYKEGK